MPTQRDKDEVYRLVIQHAGGRTVYAPLFADRKQATACVGPAARHTNGDGPATGIILERAKSFGSGPESSVFECNEGRSDQTVWLPVESWGLEVVVRIRQQSDATRPDAAAQAVAVVESAAIEAVPGVPSESPEPEKAPQPARRPNAAADHRWHVALVIALGLIAWSVVTLLLTDGRFLSFGRRSPDTVANSLPVAAPTTQEQGKKARPLAVPSGLLPAAESRPRDAGGSASQRANEHAGR